MNAEIPSAMIRSRTLADISLPAWVEISCATVCGKGAFGSSDILFTILYVSFVLSYGAFCETWLPEKLALGRLQP